MMQKKMVILFGIFTLLFSCVYYLPRGYQQTITVSVYEDCGLDLAVVDKFKEIHPGASVKVLDDVAPESYPEWLAECVLAGDEPEIFVIPAEDFQRYTELGVLMNQAPQGQAEVYAMRVAGDKEDVLLGVSARAKYPKLALELLTLFN